MARIINFWLVSGAMQNDLMCQACVIFASESKDFELDVNRCNLPGFYLKRSCKSGSNQMLVEDDASDRGAFIKILVHKMAQFQKIWHDYFTFK